MNSKAKYIILITMPLLLLGIAGMYYFPWFPGNRLLHSLPGGSKPLEAEEILFKAQSFDVLKVDPKRQELRLYWKDAQGHPYGSFEALRDSLAKEGKTLRFATNAGIFSENHTPGGLHIEDGNELKSLNLNEGEGNFHMKPNGVFMLGAEGAGVVESQEFSQSEASPTIATQSGPLLVLDGQLHPAFREGSENKHVRNGVGVDDKGKIWFVLSHERVNFFDFASLFKDRLNCPDALYLDGSISGFYLPELGRNDFHQGFCGILAVVE
ncbi:MAG TPA: phosphodiester glycosidase family protein [Bacteroidia bacterium]|nr:phosphodiester glycosidase family protein [Bacteroidia bacterium]